MTIRKDLALAGTLLAVLMASASAQTETSPMAPRTGVYPGTINPAADNTVDDYTKRGTLIDGKQYFAAWGGAALGAGAYSFHAIGYDWFGSLVTPINAGSGTWKSGIANGKFAAGFLLNFNKTMATNAAGDSKVVIDGDGFGAFGDYKLGKSDVYGEASLTTSPGIIAIPGNYHKTPVLDTNPYTIHVMAGWKKDATTEGTHSLNAEASYDMSSVKVGNPSVKTTSNIVNVMFAHGYIAKAGPSYSVFLGSNTNFQFWSQDFPNTSSDPSQYGFSVMPNIVFHKDLGYHFELTSGASGGILYNMYSNLGELSATDTDASKLMTTEATVQLGLRWVKDNFAIEGSLNQALLQGGPYFISGTAHAMFAQVGVSLGF